MSEGNFAALHSTSPRTNMHRQVCILPLHIRLIFVPECIMKQQYDHHYRNVFSPKQSPTKHPVRASTCLNRRRIYRSSFTRFKVVL